MLLLPALLSIGILAGQDSDPSCSEPVGLLETVECYGLRRDDAEDRQHAILSRIDRALSGLTPERGIEPARARQSLDRAQASWAAFVEADCAAGEALFGEGNAFALDALDCEINHIETRNGQLQALEEKYLGH